MRADINWKMYQTCNVRYSPLRKLIYGDSCPNRKWKARFIT